MIKLILIELCCLDCGHFENIYTINIKDGASIKAYIKKYITEDNATFLVYDEDLNKVGVIVC